MASSLSLNAVSAKARAKFGNRLTLENYNELMACPSVGEAAAYLKNRTYYSHVLDEVSAKTIHRGRLEELLKLKQFEDYSSLCTFKFAGNDFFYRFIIMRGEVTQLLRCIRLLSFGHDDEYLFTMPGFFNRHTDIDLIQLAKCQTFDEIVSFLDGTVYGEILRPFRPDTGDFFDFTAIETALTNYINTTLFTMIDQNASGNAKRDLHDFFAMQIEVLNVEKIMRMKHDFSLSANYIRSCLFAKWHLITPSVVNKMLEANTPDEVYALFAKTRYRLKIGDQQFTYIEECFKQILFNEALHIIRFSVHPQLVFAAYTVISDTELSNIVHIIEGIRYGLTTERIREMLILEK